MWALHSTRRCQGHSGIRGHFKKDVAELETLLKGKTVTVRAEMLREKDRAIWAGVRVEGKRGMREIKESSAAVLWEERARVLKAVAVLLAAGWRVRAAGGGRPPVAAAGHGTAAGGSGRAARPSAPSVPSASVCPTHWNSFPGQGTGRRPARRLLLATAGRQLPPPPSPCSGSPVQYSVISRESMWYHP